MLLINVLWKISSLALARAAVTVYPQQPLAGETNTAPAASYTGAATYDSLVLTPPEPPGIPTAFSLPITPTSATASNLSIPISGNFLGFSIEFSVLTQVIGLNSSFLQVPFLNLMAALAQRGGSVRIRVGGNTQDYATLVDSLPDGKMIEKVTDNSTNPTQTPTLIFTPEVLYMLSNVSSLVNIKWYLGVPLNDSTNLRLQIAEVGEAILGDNLVGLQVGNEPDLYADHGHRPPSYGPFDYFGEFGTVVSAMQNDSNIPRVNNMLVGPSIATGDWTPEEVWDTGFITSYAPQLAALAVEHYPSDNCFAEFGIGNPVTPQDIFASYLNHTSGQSIVQPYLNSTSIAIAAGKPFLMLETNTASCGGFPGVSDSFGSALWGIDYALQMAYSNFSGAMFHVGGQSDFYNPFTPPVTNQSLYNSWTVAPIFYANLVVAEVFGTSNNSQIVDLNANSANMYTPAYAVYDGGVAARVVLINYITDPTGASTYTASISLGSSTPSSVQVKSLLAPSTAEKGNVTWAGQTFGANFQADGRLQGGLNIQTVNCDQTAGTCAVTVPAPGAAVVYLSSAAFSDSSPLSPKTFATTAVTKTVATATINPSVLATSNGHSGSNMQLGSTSKGSASAATRMQGVVPSVVALLAIVAGVAVIGRALM